jgi:hypothetical protein
MGANLAVDEPEAALGIGDLLAEAGCELGEEVAMFAGSGFGVELQLADFAAEQRVPLDVEGGDIALGVLDLASDAEKLGSGAFACDGGVDLAVIVKETLQGFGVAPAICLIGAGHQQGEMLLLCIIARKVGMDALGGVAEKGLEAGRWIELFDFTGIAERGIMGLLRALSGFLGVATSGVGVVEIDFALGNTRFEVVKFGVEYADLAEVTAFEDLELGTDLGKLRFALGECGANGGKLLALVEESGGVRGLLEDDFCWHAAYR